MSNNNPPPFTLERYTDEHAGVAELAKKLAWDQGRAARIGTRGAGFLAAVAQTPVPAGNVEQFLKQYPLTSAEGVALISLTEALLRVPDDKTADLLIKDKIAAQAWLARHAASNDALVRAARLGLGASKTTLNSFLSRAGAPVIRRAFRMGVRMMGRQFVLGETINDAIRNAGPDMAKGYALSFDMLGEGARTLNDARGYFDAYVHGIGAVAHGRNAGTIKNDRTGLSVKLSALHPRYTPLQEDICRPVLTARLLQLAQLAKAHDLTLTVDAEETERLTLSLQIIADVARDSSLQGWNGLGLAVQAYQKYAPELIDHVIAIARSSGRRLRVRLVKGAYWDSEIKRAQVMGLQDYPLWTRKCNTDLSYLVCAQKLLAARDVIYPMFATHNAHTMAAVLDFAAGCSDDFEFQRLHGMGAALHDHVMKETGVASTIYAPVGGHEDLLAYLVRRLIENGANTSFINQVTRRGETSIDDPVHHAVHHQTRRHRDLPLPGGLYGAWANSPGVDLAQEVERTRLLAVRPGDQLNVALPPAMHEPQIQAAVVRAVRAFPSWRDKSANIRAGILERFADLLVNHRGVFMQVLAREGFKTIADAQSEIREAIDFARYYAMCARSQFGPGGMMLPGPTGEQNTLTLHGRGAFVCISPWNFPLAIFVGQVTAALAAGNTVLAKPAEQTPLVAAMAIELLHRAGVPDDAVQIMIGDGRVGAMLTAHPDIAGVAFTGSTQVARLINRSLAAKEGPIVPLIAETGGQNAMMVDSTALLEQACDDIINSAFGSAGQRCSALRALYVQREVADRLLTLLIGAVEVLRVGDPSDPRSDIGPVIDAEAHARLVDHEKFLASIGAKLHVRANMNANLRWTYFAPAIYEIGNIRQLPDEVFGPILHVVRFDANDLPKVMHDIAATGYGLTFGIQTRLDERMAKLASAAGVGNVYINRTQIGAVVGVQPFGGQGLSGTGPKAGGPHYLLRFAHEKVVTRNTAASGGNIALVAGSD